MKCLPTHLLLTNHKCKFCIKCCFFKSLQRFTFPMPFLHCKFQLALNSRSPYFATMLFMASALSIWAGVPLQTWRISWLCPPRFSRRQIGEVRRSLIIFLGSQYLECFASGSPYGGNATFFPILTFLYVHGNVLSNTEGQKYMGPYIFLRLHVCLIVMPVIRHHYLLTPVYWKTCWLCVWKCAI